MNSKKTSLLSTNEVFLEAKLTIGARGGAYPITERHKRFSYSLLSYKLFNIALLVVISCVTTIGHTAPIDLKNHRSIVNLDLEDKDFNQVLSAISDQVGIEIVFLGEPPAAKKNIKLSNVTLDQAIAKVIRLYNIENHAVLYNAKDDTILQIELHGYAGGSGESHSSSLAILKENSKRIEAEERRALQPLTEEQLVILKENSKIIEAEERRALQPLTEEQLAILKENSKIIEAEERRALQPLTEEQLAILRENSKRIKAEERRDR